MKANKLFLLLLLALPMVFAACDKNVETKQEPILKLTSNDSLTFDAEGGNGVITYSLKNAVSGTSLTATCEAEWITNLKASNMVTFTVAANEGEARETKIVVSYGELMFEVKVRQNEKIENEIEDGDITPLAWAERHMLSDFGFPDNYFGIQFGAASNIAQLGIVLIGEEGENILSAGTYTGKNGGVLMEGCELYIGDNDEYYFEYGNVEITVGGDIEGYTFDIKLADNRGNSFHFSYEGVVKGMDPDGYNVMHNIEKIYSFNRDASASGAYHYFIVLADIGMTEDNKTIQGSFYYMIYIYCESEGVTDDEGYITLPNGVYTLSTSEQAGTINNAKYAPKTHMSLSEAVLLEQCVLTITDEGITIEAKSDSDKHLSTFQGAPRFDNRSVK